MSAQEPLPIPGQDRGLTTRAGDGVKAIGSRLRLVADRLGGPSPPASSDDGRAEIRRGGLAVLLFFGGFLGWAALAPLDAAVVAQGVVVVAGNRQTVQHRDGGAVSVLAVEEGQRVQEGDILIELGAPEVRAQERSLFSQVVDLQIRRARLLAETAGGRAMVKPAEWEAFTAENRAEADAAWDLHLRGSRGRPSSEIDARIAGYNEEIIAVGRQETLINEELVGMRELAEEQLVPLTRVRALERSLAELQGRRGELRAMIAAARENRNDTLRDVQSRLAEIEPQLISAQAQLEQTRIRAPATGAVVGLTVHTEGGVIRAGERIMDIVPEQQDLVVEARVRPEDADDLTIGLRTEVKITAFSGRDMPILDGELQSVSADRFVDERTGEGYFVARVSVSPEELQALAEDSDGARELRAGLPAQIVAPIRKRTALDYLLEPLNQALWRSFREH